MTLKTPLLLIAAIIAAHAASAQYPCVNGISTNPASPINNQLSAKRNTFFNWQDSVWAMQPAANCFRTTANESPFFKGDNLEELREAKDMKWDDGWELIRRETGLTENNNYTASNPEHLYVILYNKYTAVLRVLLLVCRNTDYNAAKITLKFHATSFIKTDLLELARNQVTALNKRYSLVEFASAVPYFNENSKWFYADFPMMYDPCTCLYSSKLNIVTRMISTASITLEGSITGDIHTKDVGGKAQVQKSGSFGWKEFGDFVNGRVSAIHGSIDKFKSETQKLAENFGRVDTAGKQHGLASFASFLKDNRFLKAGFNSVPWLKGVLSLVDVFSGGGKTTAGPQEVKLLPLSVNLTAKLSGNMTAINEYHNVIFTNPGSKNAELDPVNYPYYNEVLGIFNLLRLPVMYHQRYIDDITNQGGTTYGTSVFVNKYKFLLDSLKYVLNPAAGVSIQNMQVAMVIEALPNLANFCSEAETSRYIPDMVFEGRDGLTDAWKFRTDYYDVKCFNGRVFQVLSYFGRSTPDEGGYEASCWLPQPKVYLKFMINLRRNNAGPNTQNILYVATYPMNLKTFNVQDNFADNPNCIDSSIVAEAAPQEVNSFCTSSVYFNSDRQNRVYSDSLRFTEQLQKDGFGVWPNPNNGRFAILFKKQHALLRTIRITGADGRVYYTEGQGNISLQGGLRKEMNLRLAGGVYMVTCITSRGSNSTKIVVS